MGKPGTRTDSVFGRHLLSRAQRLGRLGPVALSAGVSAFGAASAGEPITAQGIMLDVTAGRLFEPLSRMMGRNVAQSLRDEAQAIGQRFMQTRRMRATRRAANRFADQLEEGVSSISNTISANIGSRFVKNLGCVTGVADCGSADTPQSTEASESEEDGDHDWPILRVTVTHGCMPPNCLSPIDNQ